MPVHVNNVPHSLYIKSSLCPVNIALASESQYMASDICRSQLQLTIMCEDFTAHFRAYTNFNDLGE